MRIIYKAPGEDPKIQDIPNELEALQKAVGGYIETYTIASDVVVICNEEGRLRGLPYNCKFFGVPFVGPILIVGVDGENFTDLGEVEADFIMDNWARHNGRARYKE